MRLHLLNLFVIAMTLKNDFWIVFPVLQEFGNERHMEY